MRSHLKFGCILSIAASISACSGGNTEGIETTNEALSEASFAEDMSAEVAKGTSAEAATDAMGNFELVKQNATAVQFTQLDSGALMVDASEGKVLLPVPQKARTFASRKEFIAFAKKNLGAKEVFDKAGNVAGLEGTVEQYGTPVTLDENGKSVVMIDDTIATYLGGNDGFVTVEGQDVCLTAKCATEKAQFEGKQMQELKPLGSRTECSGSLCINGGTFMNHFWFYHRAGAWTDVAGRSWLCTLFGWLCPIPADELYVSATYVKSDGGRWGFHESRVPRTDHIEISRWALDFWLFRVGDGDLVASDGVCGRHSGRRGNDSVSFSTSEGNTHGSCP